ncbi:MAG: hypothetical protein ABI472_14130 [Ginsengibacter sp.]
MRLILFFFGIIITVNATNAQGNKGSLTFQAGFPVANYKDSYNVTPTGLLFNFTHQLNNQPPFCFGGEAGILQVSGADKYYTGVYNNEYNTFLVASWNHMVTLGAIFEVSLFPENSFFDVLVNISAGTNIFITTASISRDIGRDPVTNIMKTKYYYTDNHASFDLRIGGGVELEVPFTRQKKISAVIKASYLYGSNAKYYARPFITGTQIILSPKSSGTSMVLAEAGIRMYMFNNHKKNKGF